jgi:hypothetical protein
MTWPSVSVTEGAIANPPRWDPGRKTATVTVVVPILSPRNELLGALSAVLDLGRVRPRLEALVASSPADVILLTQDGVPLVAARAAVADLAPLDPPALARPPRRPASADRDRPPGPRVLAVGDAPYCRS